MPRRTFCLAANLINLQIVKGPYNYLMSHPGKDVRKQVLSAFNVWLDIDDEAYGIIDGTIAMLHNASLL